MRSDLPAGTVTFLFTDIEGSTRLLHALGPAGYAEALAEHRRVLREVFVAHGGVEVDTQGDALFVGFPTATGAARPAISRWRSRARRSPATSAGTGGRRGNSTVPPGSTASSVTSTPPKPTPAGRSSSQTALGGGQDISFSVAELAIIAAVRGDAERAGRLWGAIETEAAAGRVGQWEKHQAELEALVLRADGPAFVRGRREGALLALAEASGYATAQTEP